MQIRQARTLILITVSLLIWRCSGTDVVDGSDSDMTVPARIEISPLNSAVAVDGTMQYQATYYDTQGDAVDGTQFEWSVDKPEIATIDASGIATGQMMGQTGITAFANEIMSESALLTVVSDPNSVATVVLVPENTSTFVGDSVQFDATVYNLTGDELTDTPLEWRSLDPNIAQVETGGLVIAQAAGTTSIVASGASVESRPAQIEVLANMRTGTFEGRSVYDAQGTATLRLLSDGSLSLSFSNDFLVTDGPDLNVLLSEVIFANSSSLDIGSLKKISGTQTYSVPAGTAINDYQYVIIHCVSFNITFGFAELN